MPEYKVGVKSFGGLRLHYERKLHHPYQVCERFSTMVNKKNF